MLEGINSRTTNTLKSFSIHFKSHKANEYLPVGERLPRQQGAILEVSAGTNEHAKTTGMALENILSFLADH